MVSGGLAKASDPIPKTQVVIALKNQFHPIDGTSKQFLIFAMLETVIPQQADFKFAAIYLPIPFNYLHPMLIDYYNFYNEGVLCWTSQRYIK